MTFKFDLMLFLMEQIEDIGQSTTWEIDTFYGLEPAFQKTQKTADRDVDQYTKDDLHYHLLLLTDSKHMIYRLEGRIWTIDRLTLSGHQYLDSLRDMYANRKAAQMMMSTFFTRHKQ